MGHSVLAGAAPASRATAPGRLTRSVRALAMVSATLLLLAPAALAAGRDRAAAIVVDAASRSVLYAENADALRYPASLTKMMTLFMAFDALEKGRLQLTQRLPVSARAAGQAPSRLGLRPGSSITVEQAILGMVTKSANDAAVVLAEAIGGSETGFAQLMTARAQSLGMNSTLFRNASGLPQKQQHTTARDMATLALALLNEHRSYYHYFSTSEFSYGGRVYTNHNRLLGRFDGADGIKTGYIRDSGFNLVASAQRDGRRLVGVVFGGSSGAARDLHMERLLERGFGGPSRETDIRTASASEPVVDRVVAALNPVQKAMADESAGREQGSAARNQDSWAVQVGAFSRAAAAERQAKKAMRAVPQLLDQTKVSVETIRDSNRLHRARLVGLSEREARDSCRLLKRKKVGCLVIAPS